MTTTQLRRTTGALAIVALTLAASASTRGQESKGDMWETTAQMVMEGLPFKMPGESATEFITRQDDSNDSG
jgi:hypothetical protein